MNKFIPILAVLIMATVLISGHVNLNFQHNLHLPRELTNQNSVVEQRGYFSTQKIYTMYLTDVIKDNYDFREVITVLDQANPQDTVVFRIAGFGGSVETTLMLINHIKSTKAKTIMIVDAPSYSGHAYLATAGDELIMQPYSYLMFHTSSAYGYDCSRETGTDRTVSNVEHCQDFMTTHLNTMAGVLIDNPWLTSEEKWRVITGHDVYITHADWEKRRQQ